jgi:DNA-binding NarL/FixJ family response regulator
MSTKILIVDDHPLVRQGLIGLLSSEPDFDVCGEASSLAEARQALATLHPDVVIVDLTLKDGNGLELIKELKHQANTVKSLALSMHEESMFAERVLRAGGMGYVSKEEASRTIVHAVRAVIAGKHYLSKRLTEQMVNRAFTGADLTRSPIERLSDREFEVFELIGQGLTVRAIASKLQRSPKTIETHREHIKEKLELKNATELTKHAVQWVMEHG